MKGSRKLCSQNKRSARVPGYMNIEDSAHAQTHGKQVTHTARVQYNLYALILSLRLSVRKEGCGCCHHAAVAAAAARVPSKMTIAVEKATSSTVEQSAFESLKCCAIDCVQLCDKKRWQVSTGATGAYIPLYAVRHASNWSREHVYGAPISTLVEKELRFTLLSRRIGAPVPARARNNVR